MLASYAASSALVKQIEQGAPADVYVSADLQWMDYGVEKKLIKDDTRVNLLGNRLVLVAPKDTKIGSVTIAPGFDLAGLAGNGRIAVGDVRAVPAGLYAKAALEKLGAWAAAEPKLAMTENVRAALLLVARGEAPLGIVYETDAKIEPAVKVVGVFPDDSHPPDHLSRGVDGECQAGSGAILGVSAHTGRPIDIRGLRFQFSDKANVVTKLCASRA